MNRAQLEEMAMQKMAQEEEPIEPPVEQSPSRQELEMLAAEKMAMEEEPVNVNASREADLGFVNRTRHSIEPLESNRMALLAQEFGQENMQQDEEGNIFIKQNNEWRPVNAKGASMADASDFAGALPEMAGGLVGTAAGLVGGAGVASVPAAIGMGAAGGAAGSAARQGLSAMLGTPQVANVGERLTETGLSAAMAGVFGGGGQALKLAAPSIKKGAQAAAGAFKGVVSKVPGAQTVGEVVESSAQATKSVVESIGKNFSFKKADDAGDYLAIADKYGIDKNILPEAVEYGDKSFVSRLGRVVAEGPSGEERLKNFSKTQVQVAGAIDKTISNLSPYRPTSRDEAGQFLIDSVDEAAKTFLGNIDETYNSMVKNAPGLMLSPKSTAAIKSRMNGLRTFAVGRAERGIGSQKQEARSLIEAVNSLQKSNGSFKQTVEALKNIGEEAFKKSAGQNRLPIDQKRLQAIYFDIHKEVIQTVRETYGDDVADNLIRNNKMISDFIGENALLSKVIGKDGIAPEKVFQSLIENGDTRKVEALKAILPPEKLQSLKASLMDSLIKKNNDGFVMFDQTANNIRGKSEIISALFDKSEIEDLAKLLKFGRRMGNPIMSTSGTGASSAFNDFIGKAKDAVFNETTLRLAKKQGSRPAVKGSSGPTKKYIPTGPGKTGSYGNVLTDSSQRQGAYFTRGPAGSSENKNKDKKFQRGQK